MGKRQGKKRAKRRRRSPKPKVKPIKRGELKSIVERARALGLLAEDCENLEAAIETLEYLFNELDRKTLTLARLRSLFGLRTSEKSRDVLGGKPGTESSTKSKGEPEAPASPGDSTSNVNGNDVGEGKKKPKGHGRNGAADYPGAEVVEVPHECLASGDPCPACATGKVYERKQRPRILLRVVGQAPLKATVIKLQSLRCNLCGKIFTARPPGGFGEEKYDATSAAMIGLLKYGSGLPFNRLERLERNLGIPFPASTQWEIVRDAAEKIEAVHVELIRQAAQGEVLHNDDTSATILELSKENKELRASGKAKAGARTGVFATCVVAIVGALRVALFFTGRNHAGENAEKVLGYRSPKLGPPIQMCDALDRNVPRNAETLLANCLAHGRRYFVKAHDSFPEECRHVLEELGKVFKLDADAKKRRLSPDQRLEHHQEHSAPVMNELEGWLNRQLDDKLIEPNSSLGDAIRYMLNHWEPLTLFLREPGAPLENNICERALKLFVLHRKNAYFYKTKKGAHVGDVFMSLIHTAELNGVNAFDYLTELFRHADDAADDPASWLPWNYAQRLAPVGV